MKHLLAAVLVILCGSALTGQNLYEPGEGKVSYITSQNVYVKFQSTENIKAGDSLYIIQDGKLIPVMVVKDISSISCACMPTGSQKLLVGDKILTGKSFPAVKKTEASTEVPGQVVPATRDTVSVKKAPNDKLKQKVTGNFSVASNLGFSNTKSSQRMRYTFSMVARNIGNSKLSADIYISFAHQLNAWNEIKSDVFNGLKIYSLALNYEFSKHHSIWLGRRINPRISNVGAIDGLQYEARAGTFTFGLVAGTRPDYRDYSFNAGLAQAGAYIGHDLVTKNGSMQTTVAFIQQTNHGLTDRRFTYLQYTNSLLRNLYFFGSVEVDLYRKTMNDTTLRREITYKVDNSPHLSNMYLSLRYRPVRQVSFSVSYSARQNVIYYETYKTIVDKLLEAATVQGFTIQANYTPVKWLVSFGANAGYRDSKNDPRPTKNFYGYMTFSRIPKIKAAATLSVSIVETGYMSGKIYSAGISRDLVAGKLSAGLDYRYVIYKFHNSETMPAQHMGEMNFSWRIMKKLSMGVYYEGTFEKKSIFNRVYLNLTQRF
ncbi:MAG: hypothetical protein WCK34_02210 [Bacteroidota bacterium]